MPTARTIYNTLLRRNAVYFGAIFAGAFAFEIAFDNLSDRVWDNVNKGVSTGRTKLFMVALTGLITGAVQQRQWKDIRNKYLTE